MDTQIVAIYCICDDILKGLQHGEDKQRQMSDAEVMTTSIVAALFFSGNMEKSRVFLQEHGYIPKMLEKSRFNRRQHQIAELFPVVFEVLGDFWKQLNEESVYVMDSFPIAAGDPFADQRGFAEAGRGRDEGHAWRAARRRSLVEPLDPARTEYRFMQRWGYRLASLPAWQELARTRPWINDSMYSPFTAYSRKSQAVLPYRGTGSTQISVEPGKRCTPKAEAVKKSSCR